MAKIDISWLLEGLSRLETRETGPVEPYPSQSDALRRNEEKYPALTPYAVKGRFNMLNKYSQMKVNYKDAREESKAKYDRLPFGPNTKRAFSMAMDADPEKAYDAKLMVSHEKKWANNWMRGVSQ